MRSNVQLSPSHCLSTHSCGEPAAPVASQYVVSTDVLDFCPQYPSMDLVFWRYGRVTRRCSISEPAAEVALLRSCHLIFSFSAFCMKFTSFIEWNPALEWEAELGRGQPEKHRQRPRFNNRTNRTQ